MRTLSTIAQMIGVAGTRAEARRGLEEIVKAKDSFIASVSHEFRAPMAVVMGLSSELNARWSDFGQEEVMEFIDLIARESRGVSHIVEDLVANGHKRDGSRIFVAVKEHEGMAVFEVSDDGPGIPAERRDRIFETHEVGETSGRTASIRLGLTVSRQLARLMGGTSSTTRTPCRRSPVAPGGSGSGSTARVTGDRHDQASRLRRSAGSGLVRISPPMTTVGTVSHPSLTDRTNAAASSSSQMLCRS